MPQAHQKVNTIKRKYICDHCREGEMLPSGMSKLSFPPQFEHLCSNREISNCPPMFFPFTYPYVDYINAETDTI